MTGPERWPWWVRWTPVWWLRRRRERARLRPLEDVEHEARLLAEGLRAATENACRELALVERLPRGTRR